MTRRHHDDPFPTQGRYRGVEPVEHDPLEIELARREAEERDVREAIESGSHDARSPLNPRGWPIQTKGVSGTSPGTDPAREAEHIDRRVRRSP